MKGKRARRQKRSSWLSSAEEGDSPQCGEMSRRDKRAGHLLKWRASCSPKSNVSHETIRENKLFFHVGCCFCLPACSNCPVALSEFATCFIKIINCELEVSKKCNCSRENLLQNNLLRKCGLLAHTSAAFLKNCCIEKLFSCLRLDSYSKHAIVCFPSTTFSTSFEKMVETNKINNYI